MHVTSPRRLEARLGIAAGDRSARTVQFEHARLAAGADVEDAAVVPDRGEERVDDVPDEDEVARLASVAEDRSSGSLRSIRSRKIETTPPSRLDSWRGPKTFPKRNTTCPVPWMRFQP